MVLTLKRVPLLVLILASGCSLEIIGSVGSGSDDDSGSGGYGAIVEFSPSKSGSDPTSYFDQGITRANYVIVKKAGSEICSGILVADDAVVTRAQCVDGVALPMDVTVGVETEGEQTVAVSSRVSHSFYNLFASLDYNISVLHLSSSVTTSSDVEILDLSSIEADDRFGAGADPFSVLYWLTAEVDSFNVDFYPTKTGTDPTYYFDLPTLATQMVYLETVGGFAYCSGIILSADFILTRAECADLYTPTDNVNTGNETIGISLIAYHPNYGNPDPLSFNLAIVYLSSPLTYDVESPIGEEEFNDRFDTQFGSGDPSIAAWIMAETGVIF